jgi:hypothetical protein
MSPEYIVAGGDQRSVESTDTLRADRVLGRLLVRGTDRKGRATYDAGRFALYQVGSAR